jgi:hypothetical protein
MHVPRKPTPSGALFTLFCSASFLKASGAKNTIARVISCACLVADNAGEKVTGIAAEEQRRRISKNADQKTHLRQTNGDRNERSRAATRIVAYCTLELLDDLAQTEGYCYKRKSSVQIHSVGRVLFMPFIKLLINSTRDREKRIVEKVEAQIS